MGAYPQIVDWNEDGKKDLLVGDGSGFVTLFINTGTNSEPSLTNSGHIKVGGNDLNVMGKATPVVNDWNEDGKKDLLVGQDDGRIALFINEGTNDNPIFNAVQYIRANGVALDVGPTHEDRSAPEVADLDGDGLKDLIIGQKDGKVYFYSNSGTNADPVFTASVNLQAGGAILDIGNYSRLDIVDWDEDGDLDLLVGEEMAYVYLFRNTTISIVENFDSGSLPTSFTLSQNYPNPFNPETIINYGIPAGQSSHVTLKIYNLLGQEVRTLVDDEQAPGYYSTIWDGRDDNGQSLGSGIYFYEFRVRNFVAIKKMVLTR